MATDIKPLKPQQLMTAIDAGIDNWQSVSDTDTLLTETGKTRQELLSAIMADDEVISCREDIHAALIARDWRIWGEGVDEDTTNKLYKMIKSHQSILADVAITAKWGGYCVAEYIYQQDLDGRLFIKSVLSKDGELDKYTPRRDGSLTYKGEIEEKTIADNIRALKLLLLTSRATPVKPMGELFVIRAYPAVALRKRGFAYAGQFIARYAQPYVIGKQGMMSVTIDSDSRFGNALNKFTTTLFGLLNGGAATVGNDDSIEFHQLNGDGQAFSTFETLANTRIQKLFLGRVKTSELSSGSRAAQETDDKVREDRMNPYLSLMAQACQHAIDAYIAVNQINAPKGIWFEFEVQSELDENLANTVKTYSDTGQIEFTKDFFLNKVGLEENHFNIVKKDTTPTQANLSQQTFALSQPSSEKSPVDNEKQILYPKLEAILSELDNSQDYEALLKRLDTLELTDAGMIDELSEKMTQAYIKGLDGSTNKLGENQVDG